jgi:hypothetical protein
MAEYVFGIKEASYAAAASSNYMPSMTALPNTVKGSVSIDETEGSTTKFYVDQQFSPVKVVKTEEGELSATMQFYDLTFATVAALKGGTGNASGYSPATGYTTTDLAFRLKLDSGHTLDMYNASITARIVGGGGRDKMFALEVKAIPQLTVDNAGSWKLYKYPVV